jgi:hypothetical protein
MKIAFILLALAYNLNAFDAKQAHIKAQLYREDFEKNDFEIEKNKIYHQINLAVAEGKFKINYISLSDQVDKLKEHFEQKGFKVEILTTGGTIPYYLTIEW